MRGWLLHSSTRNFGGDGKVGPDDRERRHTEGGHFSSVREVAGPPPRHQFATVQRWTRNRRAPPLQAAPAAGSAITPTRSRFGSTRTTCSESERLSIHPCWTTVNAPATLATPRGRHRRIKPHASTMLLSFTARGGAPFTRAGIIARSRRTRCVTCATPRDEARADGRFRLHRPGSKLRAA